MRTKLSSAPVRWTIGQPLLPEHFEAQEQALRDEFLVHLGHMGAPRHGLARIHWDESQLEAGVIRISDLTLFFPSGHLVDVPGNCPPLSFDLQSLGRPQASLLLARMDFGVDYGADASAEDAHHGGGARRLERSQLVGMATQAPGAELFRLADFIQDVDGKWRRDGSYVPPCLCVKGTPFLLPWVDRLRSWLDRFHRTLRNDLRENFLAGHLVLSAQQSMRVVFELEGWLADLSRDLDPHPYVLFQRLRRFYVDVCIYREVRPKASEVAYDHLDLAGCFGRLAAAIEPLLESTTAATRANYVGFQQQGEAWVATLPREACSARQVYLLVQKASPELPLNLGRLKFASPRRLPLVHQRSLRGIPVAEVESPPFHHDFSTDVAFFGLELDDEWDHAVGERAIALYDRPALQGLRLFVYWR